jgi:mRNA-degrading endonuclease RelE of RelBE toxin-antitoxin system
MVVVPTERFIKQAKKLSKKYVSIIDDLNDLRISLLENPNQGDFLGKNCYKVRMSITSKGYGKSYGARVITCVKIINETIYLLSLYDKSEKSDLDDKELNKLLVEAGLK